MKKKIKLFISTFLVFIISIIYFPFSNIYAITTNNESVSNEKILYSKKAITNEKILYERAKNGISDIPVEVSEDALLIDEKTGSKLDINTVSTTQLLEVKEVDNKTIRNYSKTVFLDNFDNASNNNNQIATFANIPISDDKTDPSGSVTAYITLNIKTTSGGTNTNPFSTYVQITSISIKWKRLDSTVTLSNRKLEYEQTGVAKNGGGGVVQRKTQNPTINSYTYEPPTSWKPVAKDSLGYLVGAQTTVTLKRGTSHTWTLNLNVTY